MVHALLGLGKRLYWLVGEGESNKAIYQTRDWLYIHQVAGCVHGVIFVVLLKACCPHGVHGVCWYQPKSTIRYIFHRQHKWRIRPSLKVERRKIRPPLKVERCPGHIKLFRGGWVSRGDRSLLRQVVPGQAEGTIGAEVTKGKGGEFSGSHPVGVAMFGHHSCHICTDVLETPRKQTPSSFILLHGRAGKDICKWQIDPKVLGWGEHWLLVTFLLFSKNMKFTRIPYWWKRRLVQSLWNTVLRFLRYLKIDVPYEW